jgi:hypothetical protein
MAWALARSINDIQPNLCRKPTGALSDETIVAILLWLAAWVFSIGAGARGWFLYSESTSSRCSYLLLILTRS